MTMKKITLVVVALTLLLVVPVAGCRRAKPTVAVSSLQVTPAATAAAATGRTVVPVTSPSPTPEGAPEATPTSSPEAATPTPHAEATNTPTTAPTSTPAETTAPAATPTTAPTAASTAAPTTAPTAAPTAAPTVTPSGGTTHVVQPGENLFRISLHYGLSYQTVAAANGIINPNLISVGQRLTIPAAGTAPSTTTRTHVVQSGDNLFRIALKYGVTVEALAVANNISNVNLIHPGQSLVIP